MRTTVLRWVDDIDGAAAEETVSFGLDGAAYEIDLSAPNAAALRRLLARYAGVARPAGGSDRDAMAARVRHVVARARGALSGAPAAPDSRAAETTPVPSGASSSRQDAAAAPRPALLAFSHDDDGGLRRR